MILFSILHTLECMLTLYLYVNFSLIIRNERVSPLSNKADHSGIERAEDEI
jgi:hypothetical protein